MGILRINLPNLCQNMIHVDALDFSVRHAEEVIRLFWRSVYMYMYKRIDLIFVLVKPYSAICIYVISNIMDFIYTNLYHCWSSSNMRAEYNDMPKYRDHKELGMHPIRLTGNAPAIIMHL